MNSVLYRSRVMHDRLEPKRNRFAYDIFMFYLDLDELGAVHRELHFFSSGRPNIFSFREEDHLDFFKVLGGSDPQSGSLKAGVLKFAMSKGVDLTGGKVYLLTHLRTFGHIFNPVSFYYCFDRRQEAAGVVVEVGNTFAEMKPYWLGPESLQRGAYQGIQQKLFYVSPFMDLDTCFDFHLEIPGAHLRLTIDDLKDGRRIFLSAVEGVCQPLTDWRLLWYTLRFPFITLEIIFLIQWQALRLYWRGLPFHRKADQVHLQQEVSRAKKHA